MKKQSKVLATALLTLLTSAAALADDVTTVMVVTSAGETGYPVDNTTVMKFGDDDMTVISADSEGTTYALDEIQKIVFGAAPTGIQTIATAKPQGATLFISANGNQMKVNGWTEGAARLTVYNMQGAIVSGQSSWQGETVDISSLPHGIYIVKVGNKTAKFRK